jgi:2-amino-4-hydroxy-6-hydroxymethyldihydropteridine diphosphokinase
MNRVFLSLGSNLGDADSNIREALSLLPDKVRITRISSSYETEPAGGKGQPWFVYIAVQGATELSPEDLLQFIQNIEQKMKRVKTITNNPRIIDIDILLYNDEIIKTDKLTIPHPKMLERPFILVPLYEIAPGLIFDGRYIEQCLSALKVDSVHRRLGTHIA